MSMYNAGGNPVPPQHANKPREGIRPSADGQPPYRAHTQQTPQTPRVQPTVTQIQPQAISSSQAARNVLPTQTGQYMPRVPTVYQQNMALIPNVVLAQLPGHQSQFMPPVYTGQINHLLPSQTIPMQAPPTAAYRPTKPPATRKSHAIRIINPSTMKEVDVAASESGSPATQPPAGSTATSEFHRKVREAAAHMTTTVPPAPNRSIIRNSEEAEENRHPTPATLERNAMDKGCIKARISTILVHGPAGSGKTCSKCLIVGEDLPKVRQSTPVAARPVRIFRFDVSDDEWKSLSPQQRKNILARAAQESDLKKYPDAKDLDDHDHQDDQESDDQESDDPHATDPIIPHLTTDEELIDLIEKCSTDEPILQLHMMHIIDTGGQPQCHDLMRHFVKRRTSLYIFVFKLSDEFDAKPLIAYYDESGRLVSGDQRATQTNEQILQQCVRTMQSQKSKMLFLGTHVDQESQCSENRETKNEKLLKMALPHFRDEVIYYKLTAKAKELIFPINAYRPGEHEKDIAKFVRTLISTRCTSEEFDLPMKWYGLEIILEELSERLDRKVMHRSECLAASKKLHFNEVDFDAAIDYLDEHCLIFYYRDILPDIVFSDVQVLLDKVTELVHASIEVMAQTSTTLRAHEGFWQKFGDLARVSHAFLSQDCFKKHYVAGLFTPTELIELFKKLLIFADFDKDEYFMPALLGSLSCDELQSHRISTSTALSPFVLLFPNGGPQLGVFCCLIVFLLSLENSFPAPWNLQYDSDCVTPKCLKRNCVVFCIPEYSGSITLIDSFHHFEVHFTFPPHVAAKPSLYNKISLLICQAVLHGLSVTNEKLGYLNIPPKPCFSCPCEKGAFHHATAGNEDTCLICSADEDECTNLGPSQCIWLKSFSQASQASQGLASVGTNDTVVKSTEVEALAALLQPVAGNWSLFLGQLGVEKALQDEIAVNNSNKPSHAKLCLRDGLDEWVRAHHCPTYERVAEVLRGKTVPNKQLAEEVVERFASTRRQ